MGWTAPGSCGTFGEVLDRLRPLRDLVWPAACASCGTLGQTLCVPCAREVAAVADPRWHSPDPCPTSFPPTVAWGDYAGALSRLVVAHKDGGRADAARLLAAPLSVVLDLALDGLDRPVLIPIPSSAASRRARGRDPLLDVLRRTQVSRAAPVVPALRQGRRVRDQAGLDHTSRRDNLHGSFAVGAGWGRAVAGTDVVLVDDVVTTGATLAEATRALLEDPAVPVQPRSVCAAVICATQRTGGSVEPDSTSPHRWNGGLPLGQDLD